MDTLILPKPTYNVLRRLTGEIRPDVALSVALKDLVRLRLDAAQTVMAGFEQKYGMPFIEFEAAWHANRIPDQHSYDVESDYWAWEAASTDLQALNELAEIMV